MQKERI